ncbi:Mediator complex subunit MED14 domain containing protein [Russula decolorans]
MALNGSISYSSPILDLLDPTPNGFDEPPEAELPVVDDGQVQLRDLVSRVVQACYAEMTEMAETLPSMSDSARKRKLADFVVAWKKQVVKLYAVTKWSRDADIVQKCMNITAFLMNQNRQFEDVIRGLIDARDSLDGARLRNHDLLTSLDVLTTGSYRRLPTMIKKSVISPPRLTDHQVSKILSDLEIFTRFRLWMVEIVPIEMSKYRIFDGRAWFTVPNLFETSVCLRGGNQDDGWFFVHVEFLFTVGGDRTGMQEFPRKPTGALKEHITIEADNRLGCYLPVPDPEQPPDPSLPLPPERPKLPTDVVDAPLVRIYNFLQMISMSYQLEILWYQAERLRSLGWGDFLKVEMSRNRKSLSVSYWIRHPPARPPSYAASFQLPLLGGTLRIELLTTPDPIRKPHARVLTELQDRAKLGERRPSDTVEGTTWNVVWEPAPLALGITLTTEGAIPAPGELTVDAQDLDFERLIRSVIRTHTRAIFRDFALRLRNPVFSLPGAVEAVEEGGSQALHVHLCADETVVVTIEPRTGKISLRDTGDLGAAGRGPHFLAISEKVNESPTSLLGGLTRLRVNTIVELAEQKANYLGYQTFRQRNFLREEINKLGTTVRSLLYIQLMPFPTHYLVLVVTDTDFRYALISVRIVPEGIYQSLVMEDIGWLDVERICGRGREARTQNSVRGAGFGNPGVESSKFRLETMVLRELYIYCCARVAHTKVENQLKRLDIRFWHVYPSSPTAGGAPVNVVGADPPSVFESLHSTLSHAIPALLIQSSDVLRDSAARDAAMPNIRVVPLAWWTAGAKAKGPKVVTCVKLRHVQQLVGRRIATASSQGVLRPSRRIVYDAHEALVCFLSDEVEGCMDEFKEEWESVSKIVVIAREVVNMAKEMQWEDVRLLSFDLQTVEFTYASDYTLSISCKDQLLTGGSYHLRFGRLPSRDEAHDHRPNPHAEAELFFHALLRNGRLADALPALVSVLRDTVPVLEVLARIPARAIPKAAGWWRVMFSPDRSVARHALDFRLLTGTRVALFDASQSLFRSAPQSQQQDGKLGTPVTPSVGFRPIPELGSAISDAVVAGRGRGTVAGIGIGVVCGAADVVVVGEAFWGSIARRVSGPRREVMVKMEEGD